MAKNKEKIQDQDSFNNDGSHAIEKFRISDAVMMLIIAILCFTCVFPFIHVLAKSLSSNAAVLAQRVTFWPVDFTTEAFHSLISDGKMVYALFYTAALTVAVAVLGVATTICAAYPLMHKDLPFRPVITFLLVFPMYFGAGLIPSYLLFNSYKLLDTVWVLILPIIYSTYNMLVMRSFMSSSIPASLEESAFLDGANHFQILWKIIIPLSKPIIATLLLFFAVGRWNGYGDNLYYIKMNANLKTLSYLLYQMVATAAESATLAISEGADVNTSPDVLQAAAIIFTTLPILCVYPFVQKHFVKGAMIGAVKG